MTGTAQIIRGDARHLPLADDSVDLVVTSPPYFALRSYQDGGEHYAGQIGDEPTPAEFVDSLLEVTRECVRVLKPSGSLWVNLGDKYAGTQPSASRWHTASLDGGRGRLPELHESQSSFSGVSWGTVPTKSLMGVPWRYAIRCIDELGLILRAEVIWSKPNGLPESVTDRVRRSHETWFHFSLAPRYYSAVDEIREEYPPDASARRAVYRTPSLTRYADGDRNDAGRKTSMGVGIDENPLGKLPGSVWTIPTEPLIVPPELGVDHFAAFPTEWPRRIIQGWSPAGVCVECGEGRRPVTERGPEYDAFRRSVGDYNKAARPGGGHDPAMGKQRATAARVPTDMRHAGYACACTPTHVEEIDDRDVLVYDWHLWTPAPTTPGVVLDIFGGTGTTALVAKALGRTGLSVDMSADYCRLAEWRTNDPAQLAKAARKPYTPSVKPIEGQSDLLDLLAEEEPA